MLLNERELHHLFPVQLGLPRVLGLTNCPVWERIQVYWRWLALIKLFSIEDSSLARACVALRATIANRFLLLINFAAYRLHLSLTVALLLLSWHWIAKVFITAPNMAGKLVSAVQFPCFVGKLHHIRKVFAELTVMNGRCAVAITSFVSALLCGPFLSWEFVKRLFSFITEARLWLIWGNITELLVRALDRSTKENFLNGIGVLFSP